MSYAYELADEAMAGFRQLEVWLTEEFLDELERLITNPPRGRRAAGGIVEDFVRERGGDRFYVFFTVIWDHPRRLLHVATLGHYVRPGGIR